MFVRHIIMADIRFFFFFLFPLKYSNDGIIFEVEWHFPRSEHFGGKNRPKKKKRENSLTIYGRVCVVVIL